jgi:hypothetical protein
MIGSCWAKAGESGIRVSWGFLAVLCAGGISELRLHEMQAIAVRRSRPAPIDAAASEPLWEMDDQTLRLALQRHWDVSDASDFEVEHEICREDAVLDYPQSGERIRGRRNIQESRRVQPNKKRFTVRRIAGSGDLSVTEFVLTYDGAPSYTVRSWNSATDWWPAKRNTSPIGSSLYPRVPISSSEQASVACSRP